MESIYEIRWARLDEGDKCMEFLRKYWNSNHVLAKDKVMFDFQHRDVDKYNVVIGYNKVTHEIDGYWGMIPVALYDHELANNGDWWGAILKVNKDVKNAEIGWLALRMYKFITNIDGAKSWGFFALGPQGKAFEWRLYKYKGWVNQYYIANNQVDNFKVGKNLKKQEFAEITSTMNIKEIELDEIKTLPASTYKPQKSLTFLQNRYVKHPYFKYRFLGVYQEDILKSIWVYRILTVPEKGSVIRIMDMIGNIEGIGNIGAEVQRLLEEKNCEYLEVMNYGIAPEVFHRLGFQKNELGQDNVIVPDYFYPYECVNAPLNFGYNGYEDYCIFKADGERDRPNL